MKRIITGATVVMLAGCSVTMPPSPATYDQIKAEVESSAASRASVPSAVSAALLPPLTIELPKPYAAPEERFNVSFTNLSASQFYTSLASGTRYNMLVHPRVAGRITVDLKDVTLFEALDAVRDMYGYDYTVEGNRIFVRPIELRTRIFRVNYLNSNRKGFSDIRVTSGSAGDVSSAGTTSTSYGSPGGAAATTTTSGTGTPRTVETSKVYTSSETDFWRDLRSALEAIIGVERIIAGPGGTGYSQQAAQVAAAQASAATRPNGAPDPYAPASANSPPCRGENVRCVVINPQSGLVVVRGMPDELRNVEAFLKATQISVDRQVMIEAKILEVQLSDGFQSGVNWSSFARFKGGNNQLAGGFLSPGTTLLPLAPGTSYPQTITSTGNTGLTSQPGLSIAVPENTLGAALGSMFGFAFQASNFAALISFLETQGTVNVLSSPRIATMNNQKAVLKIGTDELFVTNVTAATTVATGSTSQIQPPTVTLQSYFSGIVLDVTPQIDDRGYISLHIRPSVTQVTSVTKSIDAGALRPYNLPVPSSNTSETDSIVLGRDGQVIAIGGLMRYASTSDRSQLPGAGDLPGVGPLFRNRNDGNQKRELIILLRPTIVPEDGDWSQDITESSRRVQQLDPRSQYRTYDWQNPPATPK